MSLHEINRGPEVRYGAGCMIMARKTGRFLLCLRSEDAPDGGTWSIWGGKGEGNETPRETALREVFEETGLRWNGHLDHVHRMETRNFSYDTYLLVVDEEFQPGKCLESDGNAWVALDEFPANLHWGLDQILSDRIAVKILAKAVTGESGRPCEFGNVYKG